METEISRLRFWGLGILAGVYGGLYAVIVYTVYALLINPTRMPALEALEFSLAVVVLITVTTLGFAGTLDELGIDIRFRL